MAAKEAKRETRAEVLLRLLKSKPGRWWSGWELVKHGAGLRFGAQIHRLRKGEVTGTPVAIESKPVRPADGVWAYRLKPEEG